MSHLTSELDALVQLRLLGPVVEWWLRTAPEQRLELKDHVKSRSHAVFEVYRRTVANTQRDPFWTMDENGEQSMESPKLEKYRQVLRQTEAFTMGIFATGTLAEIKSLETDLWIPFEDETFKILVHTRPEWLEDFVDWLFSWKWSAGGENVPDHIVGHPMWCLAERFVREGIVPETDNQALGLLVDTVGEVHSSRCPSVLQYLRDRPYLLKKQVWRLFEEAGVGLTNLHSCDFILRANTTLPHEMPHRTWAHALIVLCDEKVLDRDRLLDATVKAIESDFAGNLPLWFIEFHAKLKPTEEELHLRARRYLHLLNSPTPRTINFGLKIFEQLDALALFGPAVVLRFTPNLIASKIQAIAEKGLRYLDKTAKHSPLLTVKILEQALEGFANGGNAFVAKLLKFFSRHSDSITPEIRKAATQWRESVSASQQEEFAQVFSLSAAVVVRPLVVGAGSETMLASKNEVAPISTQDELIDRLGYVLENHLDVHEIERVLAGLIHFNGPFKPADRMLRPILKRAQKFVSEFDKQTHRFVMELPDLLPLCQTIIDWAQEKPSVVPGTFHHFCEDFHFKRLGRIRGQIARKCRLPLLSTPTHRGFWLDPVELVERSLTWQQNEKMPEPFDQVTSLLRLPLERRSDALSAAFGLTRQWGAVLRYALGGEPEEMEGAPELWAAAARARNPGADSPEVAQRFPELGPGAGKIAQFEFRHTVSQVNYANSEKTFTYTRNEFEILPAAGKAKSEIFLTCNAFTRNILRGLRPEHEKFDDGSKIALSQFPKRGAFAWFSALWPSDRDPLFAIALFAILYNYLKLSESNRASIDVYDAFRYADRVGPMGTLFLLLGLVAPDTDHRMRAVQALGGVAESARCDLSLFVDAMTNIPGPLFSGQRLAKSLIELAQISEKTRSVTIDFCEAILVGCPNLRNQPGLPKIYQTWLELLTVAGRRIDHPNTRRFLQELPTTGKIGTIAKKLLSLK